MKDLLHYDKMVEDALRGVVRKALTRAATDGLPGTHHFYITFRTRFPGVTLPDFLLRQYPEEMTIVLEHQFWDLDVSDEEFAVTLSFQNRPERLTIPMAAISAFADPAVKFGLQFQPVAAEPGSPDSLKSAKPVSPQTESLKPESIRPESAKPAEAPDKAGQVVTLDAFRKK